MELGSDGTAVVLLLIPVFSISILRSAILHIYELGKSRTALKKSERKIPFRRKLLLTRYARDCAHYTRQAEHLTFAYWAYLGWEAVRLLCWALSGIFPAAGGVLSILVLIKAALLDIPIILFFFLMTKHGKNGGVTWKWEA